MSSPYKVIPLEFDNESIYQRLIKLKPYWELRSSDIPFYTLGKNAYIEGKTPAYKESMDTYNEILINNFSDLYIVIIKKLEELMGEPVKLATDLAFPGFHIFESDERMKGLSGNWHTDYPHRTLGLEGTDHSTVTIAIKLPESGAGLDWVDGQNWSYLQYNQKDMIWHNGKNLHRIAGPKEIVPGEYRITMQGHIIKRKNGLELYW
jgi:hypothetical protein